MKGECSLIQERFVDYWEGTARTDDRRRIEAHLAGCPDCAEEFRLWEESSRLIRELQASEERVGGDVAVDLAAEQVNRSVMSRIYAEQRWMIPASRRTYAFSTAFRLRVGGLLAAIMAIFMCGLLYSLFDRLNGSSAPATGIMEAAGAFRGGASVSSGMLVEVPVSSLSDPIMLHAGTTMPEYWIALSLLGVMMTLLILNWFSRVRA